jgi:hypothetical protein
MLEAVLETRRIFAGETETARVVFYLLALVTIVIFFAGVGKRIAAYRKGRHSGGFRWLRPRSPQDVPEVTGRPSVPHSVAVIAANATVARERRSVGTAHLKKIKKKEDD